MKQYIWTATALVSMAALCSIAESRSLEKRQVHDPHHVDLHLDLRDKKKIEAKYGVKNAILGLVFNSSPRKGGYRFAWDVPRTTSSTTKRPTTTEDIVIFEKDKPVSLEFPSELFGSSYTLVTNLSSTVGDFMINSALRAQRLLETMRPFLWKIFGKKGIVIEATTDKPIFSDPNST